MILIKRKEANRLVSSLTKQLAQEIYLNSKNKHLLETKSKP
jgi:hypothetical protein